MRKLIGIVALGVLTLGVQAASAQSTSFRGFRVEGQIGDDRFHSQGVHDDHFSYGAEVGFDGIIADKFVIGPQFSYWHGGAENITTGITGGTVRDKGFQELGAGVRAGYLVTPKILVYGIGGYVNNEQRQYFSGIGPTAAGGFYNHGNADGYQLGGGVEYSLNKRFFVDAGYRYSKYDDHTSRERAILGAGVRF